MAVFARSFHVEAGGDFVCIGDASIGKGPLNAIVDGGVGWPWAARHLPPAGTEVRIGEGGIECDCTVFATAGTSIWLPPPWPRSGERTVLMHALDDLEHLACEEAPVDGIARIVLGLASLPASALTRVAGPRVARLREWVSARLTRPAHEPAPVDLLGLGPGLTPSGDDLLCGALVALHAIGEVDAARDLRAAIAPAAPLATTPLSAAFLRAAAEGHSSEALHRAIIALLEHQSVARYVKVVAGIGHTSGWDALAGAVLVLRTFGSMAGQVWRVARPSISL
ncbi:MAG: DUF2877 domain-containing protein [Hyphomicrobiaceae bacterium]